MLGNDGRLRVLCVTATLGGGGAEMHLMRILNALDRDEFQPAVAVTRGGGSYEADLLPDVSIFRLGPFNRSSTASVALAVPRIRALLRQFQPAVVCSVMDHINIATILATRGLPNRPPLMLCVQVNPAAAYGKRRFPVRKAMYLAIDHLYHQADRVVALSQGVSRELVRRDPRLAEMIDVIPNAAIDSKVLRAASRRVERAGVAPHERLLVACARLVPQKGYNYLFETVAILRRERAVRLWILGGGPDQGRLETLARKLGISDYIHFLGFQSDPWRYMAAADVFVLSSIYEGFGNVVAEAMASGVPVVSTDCPYGPAEIITDGVDGLLVPVRDPRALAAAIGRVLDNADWAKELAANGLRRANAFQAGTIAASYGKVIRSLAQRRSGTQSSFNESAVCS